MKEFENKTIEKTYQKIQMVLYVGLFILFIGVILFGYSIYKADSVTKTPMYELIANNQEENLYGYIDIDSEPYEFAYYEDDPNHVYFVTDENRIYIAQMSSETYEKIKNATYPIRVEGSTVFADDSLKEVAIESYNEIVAQKRAAGEKITQQIAVGTDEETGELLFETQEVDLSDMSYIVIIIDEVADLMSLARKEVEACVQRIAQKARAAGIHLVMATQRPDTTVITGVIKANFPTRVSFQARSAIDSMTTLGEKGAEQLLSCGDMLFSEAGRVPVRIHGAFISDEEMNRVGDFLRDQGAPEYADGVTDATDGADAPGAQMGGTYAAKAEKNADLYSQAKEIVLRDKKPTISYIQRRLGIGYNKAAGLMEQMEADGIVSPPDANNKRHIL